MKNEDHAYFMQETLRMATANIAQGGGPFAAVVVREGEIIARGVNRVTALHDPTAHAEVMAIRAACEALGDFQLTGCTLYSSCEPCPMCLGAIYWARPARVFYGATRGDAAEAGFDDALIYEQIALAPAARQIPMGNLLRAEARTVFVRWEEASDKQPY